jgi:hypothetical protein
VSPNRTPSERRDDAQGRRDASTAALLLAFIAACVVVIAAAGIVGASVDPRFCAGCHGAEAASLRMGAHSKVTCDACHASGGTFQLVDFRLSVIAMVPNALTGRAQAEAKIPDAACLQCHSDVARGIVTARGLRMSHAEVSEAGMACVECHGGTAHAERSAPIRGRYDMGTCLECHRTNAGNVDACSVCHTDEREGGRSKAVTPWRVTHGSSWQKTHGMGDLRTCSACHLGSYCGRCHRTQVPHPSSFKTQHGDGIAEDPSLVSDCVRCHQRSACDGCHGIDMPHPRGFLKTHARVVERTTDEVCYRCHDEASCKQCHDRHVHPGIPERQLRKLLENPVNR